MRTARKKWLRRLQWVSGSGGITSGILARAQNLIDLLGLASVSDDISAWKSLIARLLLFVSQLDWGERIFDALFLIFVGVFFWTLWHSRRSKYDTTSDDVVARTGESADLISRVDRQSEHLFCIESNSTIVIDMLKAMVIVLDPAYDEIHSTVSYDDETKKEKAKEASWKAHDELKGIVRKLRGYIENSFDQTSLLPWWHDVGSTLGRLSLGEDDFRDEVKQRLKSRRNELLSWIEMIDEPPNIGE